MANLNPLIKRHFLAWDRPLPEQASAWLAQGWLKQGPLDLSDQLIVVMTSQAGRRLREALASYAAKYGQAVFPPTVVTSDQFMTPDSKLKVASKAECLLAWSHLLLSIEPDAYEHVFNGALKQRDFSWALRLANTFLNLQITLSEAGLRIAQVQSVVSNTNKAFPEIARWSELGALESRYEAALLNRGLVDPRAASIKGAFNPQVSAQIKRIVVIANPDPLPLALIKLEHLSAQVPIEIVIFAPDTEASAFDRFGRPSVNGWEKRDVCPSEIEEYVHPMLEPAHQADRIVEWARKYAENSSLLGVGVADPELVTIFESALRKEKHVGFNPIGRPVSGESLYHLLKALSNLGQDTLFSSIEAIVRCPDFNTYLKQELGNAYSLGALLSDLDKLKANCFPVDLQAAQAHASKLKDSQILAPALERIDKFRSQYLSKGFQEAAFSLPQVLLKGRRLDLHKAEDRRAQEAAIAWTRIATECNSASEGLKSDHVWDLALSLFASEVLSEDKPVGAIELQGWLDLLWEDAPHLVVAGMNDGRVPHAITADAFLPESLRCLLGLRSNQERYARDAYILKALGACREKNGRLDLLFGKRSASGDPLRPSRLFFQCEDKQLANRVEALFKEPAISGANQAWRRAWQLTIPHALTKSQEREGFLRHGLDRVSVTGLRRWLRCPFRFYLERVQKMAAVDVWRNELSESSFGTLCHGALEAMGKNALMRESCSEAEIKHFLMAELDRLILQNYGDRVSLPLVIQIEAARQRLSRVAQIQVRERSAGWCIITTEKNITFEIAGVVVSGKIDRIERNELTQAVRVIDYKTSDIFSTPVQAHIGGVNKEHAHYPSVARFGEKLDKTWKDLQLPVYREALKNEYGADIQLGYFNLPKAAGESEIAIWSDYKPEIHASAMLCAQGVCEAIKSGEFWPPNENLSERVDEFNTFFNRGILESVNFKQGGNA